MVLLANDLCRKAAWLIQCNSVCNSIFSEREAMYSLLWDLHIMHEVYKEACRSPMPTASILTTSATSNLLRPALLLCRCCTQVASSLTCTHPRLCILCSH